MGNSIIAPETGWEYERKKKENESCHAHRAKLQVPFGKVQLILTNHLFILESYRKKTLLHPAISFFLPPFFKFLWTYLTTFFFFFFIEYNRRGMLGVQDTDSCRVQISEVFFTFHRLPVGSLWFPLVSTGQSCRGDGTCASEGRRKLKAKRGGGNKGVCACVEVWGTRFDWTHSCFDIDGPGRGE